MRIVLLTLALLLVACGGTAPRAERTGPDEVTAEWTSGDDVPLDPAVATDASR
jgi:hypothetical protein